MNRTYATQPEATATKAKPAKPKEKEGHRETVEAIVVAFILALLVRGFEAEAFVIPTGSMAPTLMGRHKEVTCPQCGYVYAVNASAEDDGRQFGIAGLRLNSGGANRSFSQVVSGTCVNCRYQAPLGDLPTFNGDRILVAKFPYDMASLPGASAPQRWDVVVFRYPEDPETSYIKRLVGLPGEELRIWYGDVFIKPPGSKEFRLQRKPVRHLQAMAMMVYDDRYHASLLANKPEWTRWRSTDARWKETVPGVYDTLPSDGKDLELRYHHLVPDTAQWDALVNNAQLPRAPRPTLVTDFYSYNTNQTADGHNDFNSAWLQPHWVGDLSLSARIQVKETKGVLKFELVEGGVSNRCEFDLEKGTVNVFHGSKPLNEGPSAAGIQGTGKHDVTFANFDDRLTVIVDRQAVFGDGLEYDDGAAPHPLPTNADLTPAAITSAGASVTASDLVLKRDIYYTLNPGLPDYGSLWEEHYPRNGIELFENLADPSRFAFLANLPSKDYAIGADRFLMLGDNSPMSKDSRGWSTRDSEWDSSGRQSQEVPRDLLTGKAFFVYWPHGTPFGPTIRVSRDLRIPFRPYFERMKWIR